MRVDAQLRRAFRMHAHASLDVLDELASNLRKARIDALPQKVSKMRGKLRTRTADGGQ
jgi:hypothetical protein